MSESSTREPVALSTGRVVITGGTGFLGRNLARHLVAAGCTVVVVSRHGGEPSPGITHERWDARTLGGWTDALDGAIAVVNLAGRTVDCVKTPANQDEILRSRVESTRVLGQALERAADPPRTWVQMSTAHIHGDPATAVMHEDSVHGVGLAPLVGRAWEEACHAADLPDVRRVFLRTSFALGRSGGALPRLARLVRWGLGGKVGHGRQGISWIHETDLDRLFSRAITDETFRGVYLATAPEPVSNGAFMRALRRAMGMPIGLPAAAWMVRLGAPLVMRTDPELALLGRYCVSERLPAAGFEFRFPTLDAALADLFGKRGT